MSDDILWSGVVYNIICNDDMTFLEFGTASGNTMRAMLNNLERMEKTPKRIVSFDSFEGLPEEQTGILKHNDWIKGAFNLTDEMDKNGQILIKPTSIEDGIQKLYERFKPHHVEFVKGFYSETLNDDTAARLNLKPACFIHIDCDIYISSIQVLEFLAKHKLFAEDCLVRYDDWHVEGLAEYSFGESLAHKEICDKYNLKFEQINHTKTSTLFRFKGY